MKKCLPYLVVFLIGALAGMWEYRQYHFHDEVEMGQHDTVVVYDTIRMQSPVEIRRVETRDTLILPIHDTLRLRDTVYLVLKRQIKEYQDPLYFARVSGYDASLDYIEVYPKTEYITERIPPKVRNHSVTLYGSAGWQDGLRLPVGVKYLYHPTPWFAVGGKVEHDFALRTTGVFATTEVSFGW